MSELALPKSAFLSLEEYDYEKINNIPVYAHDRTLEEISEKEPILATRIISSTLSYGRYLKTDIQIVSNIGLISSSQDGTTPLNHIAKWSGTQWIQVGEGLGDGIPFHDSVNVLCVDSVNNKLYAGGAFTQTGLGVPAKHLAEWTGSNWQEVGGGTNKEVWSLFSKNSNLYVGGQFTKVGSNIPAHLIACWGNNPTGVGEIKEENGVSIYPNPATNELKITSNELQLKEIKIYNVLGECVLVPPPSLQGGGQGVVNVSNLPSGIYFIQVTTAGTAGSPTGTAGSPQEKIIRKKFVKE